MQQDVLGLDVTVNDAVAVGVVECGRHLGRDLDCIVHRQLLLAADPVTHRLPFDVRHHVEEKAIGLSAVVQRQDVRMLEVGGRLDFAEEPLGADDRGEFRPQHLDGDAAVVLDVLRQVHGGHAALAEFPLEAVAVGQGLGEAGEDVGHLVPPPLSATRWRNSVIQLGETTSWKSSAPERTARTRFPSRDTS